MSHISQAAKEMACAYMSLKKQKLKKIIWIQDDDPKIEAILSSDFYPHPTSASGICKELKFCAERIVCLISQSEII